MADGLSPEWEYRIGKLDLDAGDILIVKFNEELTGDVMSERGKWAANSMRGTGVRVLVIDSRCDLSVLTRAEIEERAVG